MSANYPEQRFIPARLRHFVLSPGAVCFYCGLRLATEVDHVVPVSQGGKSDPENLVPACYVCNHSKFDRTIPEWFSDIGLAVEKALLTRYQRRPAPIARPRAGERFDELVKLVARENNPDACWPWRFQEYCGQVQRRVYEKLRHPIASGRRLTHLQLGGDPLCVNPDHYAPMTKAEYLEWLQQTYEACPQAGVVADMDTAQAGSWGHYVCPLCGRELRIRTNGCWPGHRRPVDRATPQPVEEAS